MDPSNQWYTLAYLNALGGTESYDEMLEILKDKTKEEPDEVEWEFQTASVLLSQGKTNKSIRLLEKIEEEKGFSEKITLMKASAYESEGKYDLAKDEINKVMVLFPEAIQFRIVAAELCMKNGEEDEAAGYYSDILEIDSTNIFALTNLTDYYRKKGDYGKSIQYLARSFRSPQIDVKRKLAIMSYYLSDNEFQVKYRGELENLLSVFLEVHPEEPEAMLLAADFYIGGKEYEKAFQQLKRYLDNNSASYPIYMQAILLANATSMNQELVDMADRALEQYPDSTDLYFFRGIGYYEMEQYEKLIENFKGISLDRFSSPEYGSQSKMLVAEAYYRMGDHERSDSLFEQLIREEPDNYMVLNNYSFYLAERGEKLKEAREWSRTAILNNPDNATFLDTYAWVLYRLEEFDEAERYILEALNKGGENDPEINEHAGDIQAALSSYEVARSYYNKAILLGGDRERIEKKIGNLGQVQDQ
jgi:tetratricopeptide (TPR) repeat protein